MMTKLFFLTFRFSLYIWFVLKEKKTTFEPIFLFCLALKATIVTFIIFFLFFEGWGGGGCRGGSDATCIVCAKSNVIMISACFQFFRNFHHFGITLNKFTRHLCLLLILPTFFFY